MFICLALCYTKLFCGIRRELETMETKTKGLIEFRKVEVMGGAGQAFHLANVWK